MGTFLFGGTFATTGAAGAMAGASIFFFLWLRFCFKGWSACLFGLETTEFPSSSSSISSLASCSCFVNAANSACFAENKSSSQTSSLLSSSLLSSSLLSSSTMISMASMAFPSSMETTEFPSSKLMSSSSGARGGGRSAHIMLNILSIAFIFLLVGIYPGGKSPFPPVVGWFSSLLLITQLICVNCIEKKERKYNFFCKKTQKQKTQKKNKVKRPYKNDFIVFSVKIYQDLSRSIITASKFLHKLLGCLYLAALIIKRRPIYIYIS